jgi:hypothetical protein
MQFATCVYVCMRLQEVGPDSQQFSTTHPESTRRESMTVVNAVDYSHTLRYYDNGGVDGPVPMPGMEPSNDGDVPEGITPSNSRVSIYTCVCVRARLDFYYSIQHTHTLSCTLFTCPRRSIRAPQASQPREPICTTLWAPAHRLSSCAQPCRYA